MRIFSTYVTHGWVLWVQVSPDYCTIRDKRLTLGMIAQMDTQVSKGLSHTKR